MAPPGFCNSGEVRYGSIGGLEYEVPQSRLYCLCINVALCSTTLQCICRVIRRRYNESTHILHNFWTSTHRGEASPHSPWRRHWPEVLYSRRFVASPHLRHVVGSSQRYTWQLDGSSISCNYSREYSTIHSVETITSWGIYDSRRNERFWCTHRSSVRAETVPRIIINNTIKLFFKPQSAFS